MKSLTVLALALLLSACGTTPRQKAMIVGSVLLTGALAAAQADRGNDTRVSLPSNPCASPEACR
jgi:hypothetical protein